MSASKKKLRWLVLFLVVGSLASIAYGYQLLDTEKELAHRFIGVGVIGLFLVAMPVFLFSESRGKQMKDYMLTDENLKKMREKERDSADNQ